MTRVRAIAAALLAPLLAAAPARAAVSVPPFAAPDDLSIFGPEVARAVAAALDRAGVDVTPSGIPVAGRIDGIDRERVRLRASFGGHSAQIEGYLERVDTLASDLGVRLAQILPTSARRPPGTPPKLAQNAAARGSSRGDPSHHDDRTRGKTVLAKAEEKRAPEEKKADLPAPVPVEEHKAEEEKKPAAVKDEKKPEAAEEHPAAPPSPPAAPPAAVPSTPPAASIPAHYAAPPPSRVEAPAPYVAPAYAAPPPPRFRRGSPVWSGMVGRAVLHTIGAPDGCALGGWATYAARDVLERRLRVQAITSGACGFTSPGSAAAEASRYGAHTVVMAGFTEPLRIEQLATGLRAVGRLRVIVVRDGQVVFDRTPQLTPRMTSVPEPSRAAYDLVNEAFNLLGGELLAVLSDPR